MLLFDYKKDKANLEQIFGKTIKGMKLVRYSTDASGSSQDVLKGHATTIQALTGTKFAFNISGNKRYDRWTKFELDDNQVAYWGEDSGSVWSPAFHNDFLIFDKFSCQQDTGGFTGITMVGWIVDFTN